MLIPIVIALISVSILAIISGHPYLVRFTTNMMMWISLTESLNTITGYVGRVDFGHILFFGVGAYTIAYFIYGNILPWYFAMLIAVLIGVIVAAIIGYPTLRLHGAYFAIATWSFAEASKQLAFNIRELGGSFGISIRSPLTEGQVTLLMTAIAILSILINFLVERGYLYLALNAIRNNELVASTYGVSVVKYRVIAYMLSSIPASLAGASYALWINYVYPGDVFAGLKTDQMFVMLLLGGVGSYIGALIGSVIISILYEILWTLFSEQLYLVLLGLLLMGIIMFLPNGIAYYLGLRTVSGRTILVSLLPIKIKRQQIS